jgi:hypothetical protein
LNGLAADSIQAYSVPKEHPALPPAQTQPAADAPDIPVNAAPIRWTLPAGWVEKPAGGIRLASFAINGDNGTKAEVAITSFPGSVGTELDNVNRWRSELALPPVEAGDVVSEPVAVDSFQGKLFDLAGASQRTVVAMIPRNGDSWFVKLRGDFPAVASAKPVFLEFLKSLHFGGAEVEPAPAGGMMPPATDPHAGLGMQGMPNPHKDLPKPETAPVVEPKWNVPAQWVPTSPRVMVFKSFSVSGGAGAKAEITVSFFPGDVGGVLNNVNRWRGQLGQQPIAQSQLDSATEVFAAEEGSATLVDFTGTDAKTGKPARMIGAIVPRGDKTWFYKMMGDGGVVGGRKDSFVAFVKSAQYSANHVGPIH